jgi:murein DD-endopeptidase MepM/ murein hydrolase activator NlpD
MYEKGVSFKVTSPMGVRPDPFTGKTATHKGIDTVCYSNRTLYAPEDGTITLSGAGITGGKQIHLTLADGRVIRIFHMASIAVRKGQKVKAGDKLGVEGKTGRATGVHCHIELWSGIPNKSDLLDIAEYLGIPNKVGTYISETETDYRGLVQKQCQFDLTPTMRLLDSHPQPKELYKALWECLYERKERAK